MQSARHCLRDRHNGALPLPTYSTGHRQQHEYVAIYYTFLCVYSSLLFYLSLARYHSTSSHSLYPILLFPNHPSSPVPSRSTSLSHHTLIQPSPDYCIVAFFIVIVISVVQWFVDGRKNYKGPVLELVGEGEEPVYAADNLDDKVGGSTQAGNRALAS